jgi:arylsulfatase A
MTRLVLCGLVLVLAAIRSAIGEDPAPADRPPNIVLILVDDLGWTDLACYGSTYYETPNIDRLATEGMRFTNAYAACPVCSPTRASVLTGRAPARHGITDWIRAGWQGTSVPEDRRNPTQYVHQDGRELACPPNQLWMEHEEITIAELLKLAGYATCHIGKWHLGFEDWYPTSQGFDLNIGGCDFGHPPSYFDPYERGEWRIPTLPSRKVGEYLTDREADEAVGFVRAHADGPFFLYWAPYAVHTPLQAKPKLIAKYRAKERTNQKNATYAAMIESLDDGVGRVLTALDALELADRTLVIFTSDNGGLLGPTNNAPLRSGKGFPYEGGIRVPLLVRQPGLVERGATSGVIAGSVDLLPTICAAVGIGPPADRVIDGIDLTPILRGGESDDLEDRAMFWHFPHYRYDQETPFSIVRRGEWKLIRRYEGPTYELYDLADDIGETNDLSDELPEKVAELNALLDRWLEETGAKLPRPTDPQ